MTDAIFPAGMLDIFNQVHEDGDRVLSILPEGAALPALDSRAVLVSAVAVQDTDDLSPYEAVICLDYLSRRAADSVSPFVLQLGTLVRPGGLLFLTARSVDHPDWINPPPGWEPCGSRELHCPATGEHRFFLYDDEIITLFAAWNVLHHREKKDGVIEAVLTRPEGRLVDVATALYEG